ncbi:Porin [Beijerinckiaceae bacterium RH AL1]|jgi:outer membrane immunogenic protein|nr:porin family protein [Beijerinckiaceae bacterium]VVB44830.1 Porin [Beijerinckiaceae bacterium RH CH11]VVB44910.1 Porin [Beijerinckiaceae bacterium RH AL8]VVC54558.1 Porin [Beijerinckiaceae bacterium RH AL1]
MKSLVLATMGLALGATATLAADLPSRRAPPVYVPPALPAFSWTGFEAGLHSAYTFGSNNSVRTTGRGSLIGRPAYLGTYKDGSSYVGAGVGYNYQFTPGSGVVIGASVDADYVYLHKNAFDVAGAGGFQTLSQYHQRLDVLGTANGKVGYAFDHFLLYGTGGFAFGDPGLGGSFLTNGRVIATGGNNGQLKGGYDFGGGAEYAIPQDSFLNKFSIEHYIGLDKLLGNYTTTLKVEYIHYNLGSQSVALGGIGGNGGYTLNYRTEGNQIRGGLLYSFLSAPAPVVARY